MEEEEIFSDFINFKIW